MTSNINWACYYVNLANNRRETIVSFSVHSQWNYVNWKPKYSKVKQLNPIFKESQEDDMKRSHAGECTEGKSHYMYVLVFGQLLMNSVYNSHFPREIYNANLIQIHMILGKEERRPVWTRCAPSVPIYP